RVHRPDPEIAATPSGAVARAAADRARAHSGAHGLMDFIAPLIFVILAAIVVAGGLAVVLLPRITGSALSMGLSFLGMAGLFALLGAETIGAIALVKRGDD